MGQGLGAVMGWVRSFGEMKLLLTSIVHTFWFVVWGWSGH